MATRSSRGPATRSALDAIFTAHRCANLVRVFHSAGVPKASVRTADSRRDIRTCGRGRDGGDTPGGVRHDGDAAEQSEERIAPAIARAAVRAPPQGATPVRCASPLDRLDPRTHEWRRAPT